MDLRDVLPDDFDLDDLTPLLNGDEIVVTADQQRRIYDELRIGAKTRPSALKTGAVYGGTLIVVR